MKDESEEQDVTKEAPPGLPSGTRHLGLRSQGRVSERTVGGVRSSFIRSQIIIKRLLNDVHCCKHGAIAVNKVIIVYLPQPCFL